MSEERKIKVNKGKNLLIILFVFIQFQVSSVCNLHGFSPQGDYNDNNPPPPCNNSKLSESEIRIRRDSESFYNSFVSFRKVNEKINYLTGTGEILTREIKIKQGRLKGVVKEFKNSKLKNVETFLGIPYAAPPVKSLRFMPPGSPPTWKGVKILDTFGAVCPQKPPDLTHEPLKTMNAGHYNHLKGLMAFLSNQSEDCLYLNIYAPMQDYKYQQKFPVIVYIHGESFEWNSGNPYDGSILASYGNVVVVTINFRLGILGFLRPGLSDHTVSNFGLLDQIAALQWIKENIEEFGGDSSLVTLMGHGTGAACINFLMVSPVSMASQGLFHKAILMSGTALSDWALTHNPLQFTIQVAEALNCPLIEVNDELSNCLRRKRLSEIMSVKITVPEFQTAFGPIVDGSVVPNTPQQVMGVYQNLFTRYELLYGMTEWETYHLLDPVSLTYGMLEGERNEFLRKYMYSRYEALPYFALATTLSEYLDWRKPIPPAKSAAEEHRDLVLDLLSDAMFGAPIIQMALYHSKINPKSYLYIFQHKNKFGEFAGSERSISGEEIAYVFGIPLLNEEGPLSHHKFSISEQLLSESILTYFTNFAKTGNPNAPRRSEYLTQGPKEWQQYDVYWPEYDSQNQSYLAFEIPPHVSHHYRSQMTQFWNEILPDLLNNPTKLKPKPEIPFEGDFRNTSQHKMSPPSRPPPPIPNFLNPGGMRRPSEDSSPWTYGTVRVSPEEYQRNKRPFGGGRGGEEKENHSSKQMDRPLEDSDTNSEGGGSTSSSSVPYFVALSVCLLIINASVIGFYCHKRKRLSESRRDSSRNVTTTPADLGRKRNCSESVYSVVECSESSQAKTEDDGRRGGGGGRLKRCLTNTAESSTKVRKWFQQEVVEKYSKNRKEPKKPETIILSKSQKSDSISECSTKTAPPLYIKPILKNPQRIYKSNEDLKSIPRKQVQKVSVGVDATPSTRGDSVLKQTPIEITKSLDRGLLAASYSAKTQEEEDMKSVRRSRTSVSLQLLPTSDDLRLGTSETIKLEPRERGSRHNFRTFAPAGSEDVNVTSRDPEVVSISEDVHVDPLENIQKRNFPKVLPDYPGARATERLSFPQSSPWNISESNRTKLHPPPPPPPRVSTLLKKDETGEQKFLTFSSVTFKKPEKDKIELKEPETDDSSSTTGGTIKKQPRGGKKVEEQKENKSTKRREQPSIVIQPKIGPKKADMSRKGQTKKLPHVNLQLKEPNRHLDTKGPSDRV